ncbi:MAG: NAD(P)-dependent oxidoreductase [Acidimicrobiia bacterium]|nr:NAD(P)-dependent oxidoreductase [Acidimicrobiia bacterium]
MPVKVLIADKFSETHLAKLEELGHDVTLNPDLGKDDLPAAVPGYEVLIVRSTKVTPDTIDAGNKLNLVIRAGAGVNTIAVDHAAENGVFVCNTPGKNAVAVAELAMGLIMAIDRNIPDQVRDLRKGKWRKKRYARTKGLAGRSIGIVGLGAIGLEVAKRANAFDMEVAVVDRPNRDPLRLHQLKQMGTRFEPDLLALAGSCDILSFHVPATPETEGLVSRELLAAMKPETVIVNTSRGSVIDEEALVAAIEEKDLRVGLDVYKGEPGSGDAPFESTLAQHPAVYGTHHIGASTNQAQEAIADAVIEAIESFQSGSLLNCVNVGAVVGTEQTVTIRHHNVVGVLAGVLVTLREAGLNVEHMENFVLSGRAAASALIHVIGDVTPETIDKLEALDHVIAVSVNAK